MLRAQPFGRDLLVDRPVETVRLLGLRQGRRLLRTYDRRIAQLSSRRYG